jgi:hypothetical protein
VEIVVMRAPRQVVVSNVATGNPIQQGPIIAHRNADMIRASRAPRNGLIPVTLTHRRSNLETHMRHKFYLSALIEMSLIGTTSQALAQGAGAGAAGVGTAPGTGGVPPVGTTTTNPGSAGITSAPGGSSTTGTGTGGVGRSTNLNSGTGQPGTLNTSTPGGVGTGASPSGLPGDDPANPGSPGRVGR